ncbi:MAG: nicotinate-nucleotide--dimethylbenzimidazole phosphoribosyltransferase, partial [Lentisphaerae bacterium]|nr:nicotinate-nucleotide--dimethylbenzimidazole phosphoribosyltransferase [Lentisphaerota bacterium]
QHLNNLTKPRDSLGRLEELAMRYCLIRGTTTPIMGTKKIFCFAGDHGVADEGVSTFPKEVTRQMVLNMLDNGAAINVLARHANIELEVVDIGVATILQPMKGLRIAKIKSGTDNITKGPAMSVPEAVKALETGIRLANESSAENVTLLGTGDMGIANTTPSTALFATYLGMSVEDIAGHGTGLTDEGLKHKVHVINKALRVNKAQLNNPLETLAAVGGLEIAGIAGLILGAAVNHIPVVVDGFISTAGALSAYMLNQNVRDYLIFSHLSQEKGHAIILNKLEAKPILDLNMRLGEGTGAALSISIVEAAVKIYNEMATFSSAGVSNKT